jgi:PAS domain S-box-containing protein
MTKIHRHEVCGMDQKTGRSKKNNKRLDKNADLLIRLSEAEETLRAIREGEVDAIVVSGSKGDRVFTLSGADYVYRLIVETMKEAALLLTFEGKVLFCNRQFSDLIKIPQKKILGQYLKDFVLPRERQSLEKYLLKSSKEPVKRRIVFREAAGKSIPAHVSANLLDQPDGPSICIVATDLSELESSTKMLRQVQAQRRALEESEQRYLQIVNELVDSREGLEERVRERTAELADLVDKLNEEITQRQVMERALKERSEQLSKLASELAFAEERERRRIAEVLHDDLQQLLVGAKLQVGSIKRSPDKAVISAQDLDMILTKSIEVTRSLTSELSPPILRQSGLISAFEWLAQWMKERHELEVEIYAESKLTITSEDTRVLVFRFVRELLFNVVKHARVKRALLTASLEKDQIRVQVTDHGVGFDPAKSISKGGFGLFSISERLDYVGGRIEIEAAPGKGCKTTLLIPLKARETERTSSLKEMQIRILIVDDHVIMRQGLVHLLKAQSDMDVVAEASDGAAAIKLARQFLPDVIVMDVSMPVMGGAEATRIIHSELPDIQVIGLSMYDEEEKAETMQQAGAVRYLTKSGPSNSLIVAIREAARSARERVVAH